MKTKNIDALLANVDLTPDSLQGKADPVPPHSEPLSEQSSHPDENSSVAIKSDPEKPSETYSIESSGQIPETQQDTSIDEYGQPVEKKERLYTQEEVQQMMRDRNSRGEFAKQEITKAIQEALAQQGLSLNQSQAPQEEGEPDWQYELKTLVKETFKEITKEQQIAK